MTNQSKSLQAWRQELIEQAADLVGGHDDERNRHFAAQLRGVGDCEFVQEALDLLPNIDVPKGFLHARYTIYEVTGEGPDGQLLLGKPKPAGELVQSDLEQLTIKYLVCSALCLSDGCEATSTGPGEWIESFALPIKDRGVFELALILRPRQTNDGSLTSRLQASLDLERDREARDASCRSPVPMQRAPIHAQGGRHLFS